MLRKNSSWKGFFRSLYSRTRPEHPDLLSETCATRPTFARDGLSHFFLAACSSGLSFGGGGGTL
jgi:hypothetical protein